MLEGRHLSVAFDGRPVLDDVSLAVAPGERVQLAAVVRETAAELAAAHGDEPMIVVASGHVSDDAGAQLRELEAVAATGVDALILISNRFDIANTSDAKCFPNASAT